MCSSDLPFGWTIANGDKGGSVDIWGSCNSRVVDDLLPGNNCYVDLDGGTGVNGLLTRSFSLPAGHSYTVFFDLAGNNRDWPFLDTVTTTFGSAQRSDEIPPDDTFATFQLSFSPAISGIYSLSFINSNVDGYGALLDNVRLQQVPGPLPLFGAAAAFGVSRRLRNRCRGRKP